jgi:hypothetical protein
MKDSVILICLILFENRFKYNRMDCACEMNENFDKKI